MQRKKLPIGHAEHHWDWSVKHPVLRLSFGSGVLRTPEDLAPGLPVTLVGIEFSREQHNVVGFEVAEG